MSVQAGGSGPGWDGSTAAGSDSGSGGISGESLGAGSPAGSAGAGCAGGADAYLFIVSVG